MPTIYLTTHDTKSFGVKIENKEVVKVQKFENLYNDENNILCVKPSEKVLGKCDVTNMLIKLGNLDKSIFSGSTFLLKISEENIKNICICWCK